MSLDRAEITWSLKQVVGLMNNNRIDLHHPVQRSFVWERARKSAFIESIILGYPTNKIYARRKNVSGESGKVYVIMDGVQRLSTVCGYLRDEFSLTDLAAVTYADIDTMTYKTIDVSGLKFSELPDSLQNHLSTETLQIEYYDHLTADEEREMFKRLNNGKPLNAKNKLLAACKDLDGLLELGGHEIFNVLLTRKGLDNKIQVTWLLKTWCMMNIPVNSVDFTPKVFNPMIEQLELSGLDKDKITKLYDYMLPVYNELKENYRKVFNKVKREVHTVSLIPAFKTSMEDSISTMAVVMWLSEFFGAEGDTTVSKKYNKACLNSVTCSKNIYVRDKELKNSYMEYFNSSW